MSPTLTDSRERRAVFLARSAAREGASNAESGASKDAAIFRTWEFSDVTDWVLKHNVEVTRVEGHSEREIALRRVEASAENLLAWGRRIERGTGDKIDIDI